MAKYLVGYDLNRPRGKDDYPTLFAAIKDCSTGYWWHHLDSTWIIESSQSAAQIRDALKPHIDNGDELLVIACGPESAWSGFNAEGSKWLLEQLPTATRVSSSARL